ncbi:MAG: class I SAM-dependent methyltransferase, partial [Sphingobium sp.]|nr:class I SAM-dependent methyltransferase [Sphingobium sp.]
DETLTYSCARPSYPAEPLEAAQHRKIDELLDRLDLKDGSQLLEIGCGWGALAGRALDRGDIGYTGLTLSKEQRALAMNRANSATGSGLDHSPACQARNQPTDPDIAKRTSACQLLRCTIAVKPCASPPRIRTDPSGRCSSSDPSTSPWSIRPRIPSNGQAGSRIHSAPP